MDLCHYDSIPPLVGERVGLSKKPRLQSLIGFVDLLDWIVTTIPFPLNLFFVFAANFIRAYLPGASFGTRMTGGKRELFTVLAMARGR